MHLRGLDRLPPAVALSALLSVGTLCLGCSSSAAPDYSSGLHVDSPGATTGAGGSANPAGHAPGVGSGGSDTATTSGAESSVESSVTSGGSGGTASTGSCATAEVRTIFQASCAQGMCHDSTQPVASLDLSGADPAGAMLNVASDLCGDATLLVAGAPEQSLLWLKLTQETPDCGDRMPIGGALSDADIACVEQWIVGLASGVPDCETCGGANCVDVSNDARHCGACNAACEGGQVCAEGTCTGCREGETPCGAACVDTADDPNHCGGCDTACGAGESCVAGSCGCTADPTVTFSGDIVPLFESSCAGTGCHSGRRPKEGLDLTSGVSYEGLVGVVAEQCSDGRLLVDPGAPGDSYLLHKLTGVDLCSGSLMPKADGGLPPDTVDKISSWICSGAPNN